VHRTAPGGSPRNVLRVRVTGLEQQGAVVRVRGETATGTRLAADVTPAALAALALAGGDDVVFVVKAAEVEIYDACAVRGPDGGVQAEVGAPAPASAAGRVTRTVAPPPGVGSTRAVPPCAATSAATMARPRPEPPDVRARESSSR